MLSNTSKKTAQTMNGDKKRKKKTEGDVLVGVTEPSRTSDFRE
jgi:hypothetical protein